MKKSRGRNKLKTLGIFRHKTFMDTVDSCTRTFSYVLQILCLLQYFSLLYPVASPILIVAEKTYAHAYHTSNKSQIITNKDCKKQFLNLSTPIHNF